MVPRETPTQLHPASGRRGRSETLTGIRIDSMRPSDLLSVVAIEEATFPAPWTLQSFLHEIEDNPLACNRVIRSEKGEVQAYVNAWLVDGEVRINNIAVRSGSRRRGLGEALVQNLLDLGRRSGCSRATLEVRPSNHPAVALYRKLGFQVVGRRKGYYSDSQEDALVMRIEL